MSTSFVRVGGVARMALWVCLGLLAVLDAPGATRWGLLVGINDYAPGYASSLNCCVNDAEGMRDTVMLGDAAGRWPSANIQLLTNSQATKASIRSALQTLAAQAGAGDVVVYYHSSHGGQYVGTSTYICSYNTEYSDTELGADLARFDSSVSVVVILDTCHSAGMFKSRSWAFAENAMASFRAEKARQFAAAGLAVPKALGGNIGFMTACDYNELSWESPPHGFFTGAILRACDDASVDANGDGELQFMELHNYAAAETVEDQTAQHLNAALLEGIPALAAPGGTGISDDEYEENDIRATAFDLSLHEQTWLSAIDGLGVQADDDWFKITVAPGYLRVLVDCEFTHADGNIDIALVDSTGSSLATSEGSGDVENIDFVVPESGVYYIRVHQGNAGNTYDLRWRDALDDSKPDLVIESIAHSPANPVANDVVTFTVTVRNQGRGAAAAVFNVAFWPDRASAPTISTASALSKDYNLGIAPGQAATLQFAATAPTAGTYTAWAFVDRFQGASEIVEEDEANNAGPSPVGFSWSVDDRYEPNDARASAFDLSGHAGTWLSEIDGVAVQGDDDWYRIEAGAAVERLKAECRFVHAEGDINLALYDSTGIRVDLSAGLSDEESIDFEVPGPGTYYLCVVGANARNAYDLRWMAQGSVDGDFDGDGCADIAVFDPPGGNWYVQSSAVGNPPQAEQWGWSEVIPVPADYDGDGISDMAVYHPEGGMWYILQSSNGVRRDVQWGWKDAAPVPGDYDGDGKADVAVFHQATGNWYIQCSAQDNALQTHQFGWWAVVPVPADYDGDRITDIAVYYPDAGLWSILQSSTGITREVQWGWREAVPVPGDYDGDGKADIAVFHRAAGNWYIQCSAQNNALQTHQFGWWALVPVPADYDGDGITDIAVYYPEAGMWYIRESATGQVRQIQWGWKDALPTLLIPMLHAWYTLL